MEREHDNVLIALRWTQERGAVEEGLRLAGALGQFWLTRGYLGEGSEWLEGALAVGAQGTATHAHALTMAGHLASWQGDFADAVGRLEPGVALFRALGASRGLAGGLSLLGEAVEKQGDYAGATLLQEESLALRRALGDPVGVASTLDELAWVACVQGAYERGATLAAESVTRWRNLDNPDGLAYALINLVGYVLERRSAYAQAVAVQEEALALCRRVGNRVGIAAAQTNLGWALLAQEEDQQATAHLEESLALARAVGTYRGVPEALTYLGWAAYRRGEHDRAVALQEQALARYRQIGYRWGTAWVLAALGCVVQARGADAQAATYLRESLQISHALGARGLQADALERMAWVRMAMRQAARATRLGGAAEALREVLGALLHPLLHAGHERVLRAMRDALGDAGVAAAWAEGRTLALEEAGAVVPGP